MSEKQAVTLSATDRGAVLIGDRQSWLHRLAFAGCRPEDTHEERRKKAVLTLTALAKCSVCPLWYGAYFLCGASLAALGPLVYQLITIFSVLYFFWKKNFTAFRTRQTAAILLTPFYMYLALGGHQGGEAVILWSLLSPLTALLFHGVRPSILWLLAYFLLLGLSGLLDVAPLFPAVHISPVLSRLLFYLNLAMPSLIAYLAVWYFESLLQIEQQIQVQLSAKITQLNKLLTAENQRLGTELDVARHLQSMVLPKREELAAIPDLHIACYMRPADEVGGDYYDVLQLGRHVKIGIGDVTGHGLESGLVMLMVQSIARALHEADRYDPVRFLSLLNQALYKNMQRTKTDKTMSLMFLDFMDDRVVLSGQHEEFLILREDGAVERVSTVELGFPVGLEPDISHLVCTTDLRLGRGDCIALFTDGVTEATNEKGEFYGIDRLCRSLSAHHLRPVEDIKTGVIEELMHFIGASRIQDDISLLVIKR